ncbi:MULTISPECIES: hypothetical protein [unclassified Streptomyces]|uniref:hypothetical protein n=1 Tax=unclassified Streptomyces TaxID=2593676 RepID=UPI0037F1677C
MLADSFFPLIAALAGYTLLCIVQPFGTCRRCDGFGHRVRYRRNGKPKAGKVCRRCHGHGKRLRFGRRLHNHTRRIHTDGTRTHHTERKETLPWQ